MDSPPTYCGPHLTKHSYDCVTDNARIWALEDPKEAPAVAARIYHVKEDSTRKSGYDQEKRKGAPRDNTTTMEETIRF
jgi:hypothetical protein